ncbi:hypothetical protein ACFPK5_17390 [Streptomyces beijiangensis]|uniref:hypothetical protein n=1 Tax=Streptomyces beijiangensis TaxID=163361 RepID=UPI0031DC3DF7
MITQGVKLTARCNDCGGVSTRDIGQFIDRDQLWWGTEVSCGNCPTAWCEQDTGGSTPDEIRNALLAEHGPVLLRLTDTEAGLVPVLRALREVLGLPLNTARAMATSLKETGLSGTLVEMEFLSHGLRRRSVTTAIEPLPD